MMNEKSTCSKQKRMRALGESKAMSPLKLIDRNGNEQDTGDVFKWGAGGETYVIFARSDAGVSAFNELTTNKERGR